MIEAQRAGRLSRGVVARVVSHYSAKAIASSGLPSGRSRVVVQEATESRTSADATTYLARQPQ